MFEFYQRGADEGESDVVISGKQGQEVWNLAALEESFHTSAETALKPGSPACPGDPGGGGGGGGVSRVAVFSVSEQPSGLRPAWLLPE